MIRLFCIKLSRTRHNISTLTLSNGYLYSTSSSKLNANILNSGLPQSLTLSYLQKSWGLSLESAISASRKLQIETSGNPGLVLNLLKAHGLPFTHIKNIIASRPLLLLADLDNNLKPNLELFKSLGISGTSLAKMLTKDSRVLEADGKTVVEFFRENGFSEEQIATLTTKRPALFLYNVHKTFKPKLEVFRSLGFSELDVAKILSTEPYILERSLENQIMPCIQVLRRVVGNDVNVQKVIRACYRILQFNVAKVIEPNIQLLANHGVPESLILKIFLLQPKSLLQKTDRLSEIIGEVKKLGFDPTKLPFVLAIRTMATVHKTLWDQKSEAYRSFGLSKDEIVLAFKLQPMFMIVSEKKIGKLMNFYVNKLNIKPSVISKNPNLLLLSLEKRIIPRCSVLHILMSKELVRKGISLVSMFKMTEKMFMEKLVTPYEDMVPEVVKAHQGRIEFQGFSTDLLL